MANATQMIQLKPVRNFADDKFVGYFVPGTTFANFVFAISSFFGNRSCPYPALSKMWSIIRNWAVFVDVVPKVFFGCFEMIPAPFAFSIGVLASVRPVIFFLANPTSILKAIWGSAIFCELFQGLDDFANIAGLFEHRRYPFSHECPSQ